MDKKLVPNYAEMTNWQVSNGGIDVRKQEVETQIVVRTVNSTYHLTITDPEDRMLRIQGGRWEQPIEIAFNGSSWGGSMFKIGWIGYGMMMEFAHPEKPAHVIRTSRVIEARIVGDDWEYEFDWPDAIQKSKAASAQPSS